MDCTPARPDQTLRMIEVMGTNGHELKLGQTFGHVAYVITHAMLVLHKLLQDNESPK